MQLDTQNLELSLGGNHILNGIDLHIKDKSFVGIIGPNGSGKSTLLKCIYRVLQADKGDVMLDSKEISTYTMRESAKKMAVVAQHNFYNFDFTVKEVVLMGRSPHKKSMERDSGEDYQIVTDSLMKVGMEEFSKRNFSTLSGGEQQRVILARALAQRTGCLILDEPTNHLDIKYQLQLMNIVKQLNLTVVSAIHDLNIAAMYCDIIYVLKSGKIVAFGAPEDILTVDFIRDVYEVETEIYKDNTGHIHILYRMDT